jgi:hypothetical protein
LATVTGSYSRAGVKFGPFYTEIFLP